MKTFAFTVEIKASDKVTSDRIERIQRQVVHAIEQEQGILEVSLINAGPVIEPAAQNAHLLKFDVTTAIERLVDRWIDTIPNASDHPEFNAKLNRLLDDLEALGK